MPGQQGFIIMPMKMRNGVPVPYPATASEASNYPDLAAFLQEPDVELWLVAGNHRIHAIKNLAGTFGIDWLQKRNLRWLECTVVVNLDKELARWFGDEHNREGRSGLDDTQLDRLVVGYCSRFGCFCNRLLVVS